MVRMVLDGSQTQHISGEEVGISKLSIGREGEHRISYIMDDIHL